MALKPSLYEAHNNLGTVLKRQGKFDEAAAHYDKRWPSGRTSPKPITIARI